VAVAELTDTLMGAGYKGKGLQKSRNQHMSALALNGRWLSAL
jgi:hypothetical protein